MASIKALAEQWLSLDRDVETREQIRVLLNEGREDELEKRLRDRINFGTAGLRARMEAGFSRMNSLTVIQTSQGLAEYLLRSGPLAIQRGVVIGRDARHNSEKFARLAAAAFVTKGIKVWWFEEAVHTPLVSFAIGKLRAVAGVMITASHNPAGDNGYKVYWVDACQIIPPFASHIAAHIKDNLVPLSWDLDIVEKKQSLVEHVLLRIEADYYDSLKRSVHWQSPDQIPKFVYTPMHGVGLRYMTGAFQRITKACADLTNDLNSSQASSANNYIPFTVVAEQAAPDPDFPTVEFPNPEEKGALDLAMRTADANSISLIIATDPDADRLAVAEKLADGRWHQFTGNQVGILLASYVLEYRRRLHGVSTDKLVMLCSTVSTGMLRSMADIEGFQFEETLTGFKWLATAARDVHSYRLQYRVPFAFEEALGYMFPHIAYDKDGISASIMFLHATSKWLKEASLTPWQKLQTLYERYGYFADANTYLISPSSDITNTVFNHIRTGSLYSNTAGLNSHPTHLGDKKILRWRDLTVGYDSTTPDNVPDLPVDKNSQMITCELEGQTRFTVRTSGTEPKIKLYVESQADSWAKAQQMAKAVQTILVKDWFDPSRYGLKLP